MASVKIVLYPRAKKDGTYPLALRITKDRKSTYIFLEYSVKKEEWVDSEQRVKSSHPNSKRLNNFLLTKKAEASEKTLEAETQKEQVSVKALRQKVKPSQGSTFFPLSDLYLKMLKDAGNYNCYNAERPRIKIFKEFLGNDTAFSDITIGLLNRFKVHLKSNRKTSERTIVNYMIAIRAVFNLAIKEGVIDQKHYPFGGNGISVKLPQSTKIGVSASDVEKLENVILENPLQDHARNLWLTSYYFAGMRMSDVLRLKWSDIQNERLHYTMGKNNKTGSVKVLEKAFRILKKYDADKTSPDDLVFPNLKSLPDLRDKFAVQAKIRYAVNRCNKVLKEQVTPLAGIEGKLTTHVARHTFATLAGDKVPLQMLQKLYRHSDIRTTVGYQANFIYQDADDALEAVIG